MRLWCSCIAYFSSKEMGTVGICIDVLLIISIYISCLIYTIYTKQPVSKIMAIPKITTNNQFRQTLRESMSDLGDLADNFVAVLNYFDDVVDSKG